MRIRLKNKIINDAKLCKSWFSQIKGLMFSRQKNLVFEFEKERKICIHMFFVFYPIDLIFLNENKNVIELKERLKPFTIYSSKNKAKFVLELENGVIENNKISIGDKISF